MKIFSNPHQLQSYLKSFNGTIGFVPTMGALHDGHVSLLKKAKNENDLVVASIFINPTQFLEGEDFNKYPKKNEADKKICELSGVDILFIPEASHIYTNDEVTVLAPNIRGFVLEGFSRPGHFNGVLTIVLKLLNIVKPNNAYFGKKDAQQLNLISLMVKQLFLDINIVAVETLRDYDGLALSSRNVYLSSIERQKALKIPSSLTLASKLINKNIFNVKIIKEKMREKLDPLEIIYIEILDRDFNYIDNIIIGNTIILVEVKIGSTRLLDNIWI